MSLPRAAPSLSTAALNAHEAALAHSINRADLMSYRVQRAGLSLSNAGGVAAHPVLPIAPRSLASTAQASRNATDPSTRPRPMARPHDAAAAAQAACASHGLSLASQPAPIETNRCAIYFAHRPPAASDLVALKVYAADRDRTNEATPSREAVIHQLVGSRSGSGGPDHAIAHLIATYVHKSNADLPRLVLVMPAYHEVRR